MENMPSSTISILGKDYVLEKLRGCMATAPVISIQAHETTLLPSGPATGDLMVISHENKYIVVQGQLTGDGPWKARLISKPTLKRCVFISDSDRQRIENETQQACEQAAREREMAFQSRFRPKPQQSTGPRPRTPYRPR